MDNQTTKTIVDSQAVIQCLDTEITKVLGGHATFTIDEIIEKINRKTDSVMSLEKIDTILQKVRISRSYGIPSFQKETNDILPQEANLMSLQEAQIIFSKIRTNNQYSSVDLLEELVEKTVMNSFTSGVTVSLLQPGLKGWQKGKLRICFEFIPENNENLVTTQENSVRISESPLDGIRQLANSLPIDQN